MREKFQESMAAKWPRMLAAWIGVPMAFYLLQFFDVMDLASATLYGSVATVGGSFFLFRRVAFRVGLLLAIGCALFSLFQPPAVHDFFQGLNYKTRDFFFNLRGPQPPTGEVVIIDIDQKSLEEVGQWPWPRTQVAVATKNILEDGAKAIGFDIVFAETDRNSLQSWANRIGKLGQNSTLPERVEDDQFDQIVVAEWQQRLQAFNPSFVGENADAVVEEFLRQDQLKWEEQQQRYSDRMTAAGRSYSKVPYRAPQQPLQEMARKSVGLFFLDEKGNVLFDNDRALAEQFRDPRVVAGGLFIMPTSAGAKVALEAAEEAQREQEGMILRSTILGAKEVFPGLRSAISQVINVPEIQQAAMNQGMFNIVPDRSGSARHYTMLMEAPVYQETMVLKEEFEEASGLALLYPDNYENKIVTHRYVYPSISLAMVSLAEGATSIEPSYHEGRRGILLRGGENERFIPLDFKADLHLNFRGFGGAWQPEYHYDDSYYFTYVSMVDVLRGEFPEGFFKDKFVFIGSTDATLSDLVGSPFRPAFPGLEVHATMLDNLVAGDFLVEDFESMQVGTFFGLLFGGCLVVVLTGYASAVTAGALLATILTTIPLASYYSFVEQHMIIDFAYSWLCLLLLSVVVILVNYLVEGREKRFVTGQFAKMVSPEVLKKLQQDPSVASLKGQKAEISVLFSDLVSFTTISESLEPERLVDLLNDYLTPMAEIIMKERGFIDKFMGDAVMAVWGVPFPDDNHAVEACRAALRQQERIAELAPVWKKEYGVNIEARIGIGTGMASAAMMGSESRKSYTVMGDVVNLGARLEPACKDYGISILVCEQTVRDAEQFMEFRCVDRLVVKGQSRPVAVYELLGEKGKVSEEQLAQARRFEEALALHWEREWDGALSALREMKELQPEDVATDNLQKRVESYQVSPPKEGWQGEFVKTSK